ncbi:hypothetical protein BH10CHL1_BH10CHL1_20480 [soil metagenome]
MTRAQTLGWSIFLLIVGGGIVAYVLQRIPPTTPDGQWNLPVIILFILALASLSTGVGALGALALHQRWPALGGQRRYTPPKPEIALRQGILLGVALTVIAIFALVRTLDITFILVTFLLLGLVEAFLQNRQAR